MFHAFFSLILLAAWGPAPACAARETFGRKSCRLFYGNILGPTEEEKEIFFAADGSFYKIPRRSPADTDLLNRRTLRELRRLPRPAARRNPARLAEPSPEVREKLFRDVMSLPEVRASVCGSYNGSGKLGFCFGRAFAVHRQALGSGIDKARIRKLWIVGDLREGAKKWRYHVSTIIHGTDGVWYAFDPSFGKIVTAEEWYSLIRKDWDPAGTARLYATAPGQLFPYDWSVYSKSQLKRDVFRGFFDDLLRSMKREAGTPE